MSQQFDEPRKVINHTNDRLCVTGDKGIRPGDSKVVNAAIASEYYTDWIENAGLEEGEDLEFVDPNAGNGAETTEDEEDADEPDQDDEEDGAEESESLDLNETIPEDFPGRSHLEEAGLHVLGEVVSFAEADGNSLTDINGIGEATAESIHEELGLQE